MNRKKGFSLIELLVVIAIIGILAGITFPVFARARVASYRSSDMTSMNTLRTALQLYRSDQGGYPPALLGYVNTYSGNPNPTSGDIVPADKLAGALFPKRVDSLETFRPAYVRPSNGPLNLDITTAVWPNKENPNCTAGMDCQRFGPADGNVKRPFRYIDPKTGGNGCQVVDAYYYRISGYDVATVQGRNEIHYAPFWSGWTVAADPCNPNANTESGSASDDKRQLGYFDPPETTVITWNGFYRDYTDGIPQHGKQEIVLFLGGAARPYDSYDVSMRSWKVAP